MSGVRDALHVRPSTHCGYGLGCKPDLPDIRDHTWAAPRITQTQLPPTVRLDLDPKMPGCYDQLQLGACVANGIAGAMEWDLTAQNLSVEMLSRLFIYFNARYIEGTVKLDHGAQIRDGIKSVAAVGAPPESEWPYDVSKFAAAPPAQAYTDAAKTRLINYQRVPVSALNFQKAVATRRLVVFGMVLFDSFPESLGVDTVPMPTTSNAVIGAHCMCVCGYAMINGQLYFRIRNSWSPQWGDNGYCWIPAAYVASPKFTSDAWVLTAVS